MDKAIEVRGLKYRAGKSFEIRNLDLNVPSGSIYGFLGPNGAGKTTTIRLIMGMLPAHAGTIDVLGHRVPAEMPQALARTGYVPERPHLYPQFTIDEMVRYHSAFHPRWDEKWVAKLRKDFALPGDRKIGRLSKGESGKLTILLALSQQPELLVLDEPTDGLDPMVRRDVFTAVLDYVAATAATVFVSSHLVHELERMCDWVGVLDYGRMIAEMPIIAFKSGVKRIRLINPPSENGRMPFDLLSRIRDGTSEGENWVVRGWQDPMRQYFEHQGALIRDVIDLDLEEVFVELLRSARQEEE